jgi:hypothetical protein
VDRMFSGDESGRITELLQNARRAGAKNVWITQKKANDEEFITTVKDDGCGVDDYATLLNAGKTDWNKKTQQAEDPAGMGLFCLAPRTLTVTSNGKTTCIEGDGWRGAPVKVLRLPPEIGAPRGTILEFKDKKWHHPTVERCAVFSGLNVHLGPTTIHDRNFIIETEPSTHIPELGVRIQVENADNRWSKAVDDRGYYNERKIFLNFHGQVIRIAQKELIDSPIVNCCGHLKLRVGVHLTGEPTDLKMILPARTGIVKNKAAERLGRECEKELYRWVQRQSHHSLSFFNFTRAKVIGIPIAEAEPAVNKPFYESDTFQGHFNYPDVEDPVVTESTEFIIRSIEDENDPDDEDDERKKFILKAMNLADVPVGEVDSMYEGYSWVDKLVTLKRVTVEYGEELFDGEVRGSQLSCVDHIKFKAEFSDGRVEQGDLQVCPDVDGTEIESSWSSHAILTPDTINSGHSYFVWDAIGGRDEDEDWERESHAFEEEYEDFTDQLIGPDEASRRRIWKGVFDQLWGLNRADVERVEVDKSGDIRICYGDDQVIQYSARKT